MNTRRGPADQPPRNQRGEHELIRDLPAHSTSTLFAENVNTSDGPGSLWVTNRAQPAVELSIVTTHRQATVLLGAAPRASLADLLDLASRPDRAGETIGRRVTGRGGRIEFVRPEEAKATPDDAVIAMVCDDGEVLVVLTAEVVGRLRQVIAL